MPFPAAAAGRRAFTLIEVVLALGIVSFALVSLLGLLALGTTGLGNSINISTETQIVQSLDSEVVNLNYSALTAATTGAANYASTFPRFYDADGELLSEGQANYSPAGNVIYAVALSGSSPALLPGPPSASGSVYSTGTANSLQLVFTIGSQLDRSGYTLSGWNTAVTSGSATVTSLGKTYCIWAINNGR